MAINRSQTQMKRYFSICVSKYEHSKLFEVVRPASLDNPKNNAVMFITEQYMSKAERLYDISECLVFWPENIEIPDPLAKAHAIVKCENPHNEYCRFFRDNSIAYLPPKEAMSFTEGAWIAEKAILGSNVTIMPGAYIGGGCTIGNNVYIGCGTKIVGEVTIGNDVVIRENTVIGADGLTTDREIDGSAITMPQFGSVIIEDAVQIGANTVIARGAIDETRICRGAKIDNACFISHNVTVGEDSFIVGETIMFGSSSSGKQSMISGNSTIRNGVVVGEHALVGMGSVVVKSVSEGAVVKGNPAK